MCKQENVFLLIKIQQSMQSSQFGFFFVGGDLVKLQTNSLYTISTTPFFMGGDLVNNHPPK